ncbi:hypothetical protein MPLB_1820012 [Mesorhizobium sp. ORS 3324]|nr:hypothetical protein MPLB_1820012 [Mesorhizobium sp. ORS 3324]
MRRSSLSTVVLQSIGFGLDAVTFHSIAKPYVGPPVILEARPASTSRRKASDLVGRSG